jgi:CRP-like cAMP-binding protein
MRKSIERADTHVEASLRAARESAELLTRVSLQGFFTRRAAGTTALRVGSDRHNHIHILGCLARRDREMLEPHLGRVTLKFRQRLEAANTRIDSICFVDAGLASVVASGGFARRQTEIALIGREGMTGLAVILGADRSPYETLVQVQGHGRCIGAPVLITLMKESPSLSACLMRCAHVFAVQAGHTALANAQGKIEERLARWLLMAHDRLENDELHLTHELLVVMLGVRRAGVTTALHQLEKSALISTARDCVTVLDQGGLIESANGLYGVPEAEFDRLFSRSS